MRNRVHPPQLPIDPDLEPDDPGVPASGHHGVPHVAHRAAPSALIAVAAGGFAGTLARYGLGQWRPDPAAGFPATTLLINVSGSLLLGFLLALIIERRPRSRRLRGFLCTGLLGGWTTMSTLAVGTDLLVRSRHWPAAIADLAATLCGGVAAVVLGMLAARLVDRRSLEAAR